MRMGCANILKLVNTPVETRKLLAVCLLYLRGVQMAIGAGTSAVFIVSNQQ